MIHRILHLSQDSIFLDKSIPVFEHFYPGQNVFYLQTNKRNEIYAVKSSECVKYNPYKKGYLDEIEGVHKKNPFDIVVVHGLCSSFINILKRINPDKQLRVYWVFWGYELYRSLGEQGKYSLLDEQNIFSRLTWITPTKYNCLLKKILGIKPYYKRLEEFLPLVDFFCFWFYDDYLLLKKHYPNCHLQFRFFEYGAKYRCSETEKIAIDFNKIEKEIRVSHSASTTANHVTVMKILRRVDKNNEFRKVFPLAYGSAFIKKQVQKLGRKYYGNQFVPIYDLVGKEEYRKALSKVGVAIFGQLRQEASGNIFPLLDYGAKVFLRKNNPLFKFCKKLGYLVYSIEDDLKTIDDLCPLTHDQMLYNANISVKTQIYYDDFMPSLFDEEQSLDKMKDWIG